MVILNRQAAYMIRAGRPTAEKIGTYILTGDASWADFLVASTLSSDPNGDIGVMFRYRNTDNYYRFSMNGNAGYRRLVKKVNGILTVMWEDIFSLNT